MKKLCYKLLEKTRPKKREHWIKIQYFNTRCPLKSPKAFSLSVKPFYQVWDISFSDTHNEVSNKSNKQQKNVDKIN